MLFGLLQSGAFTEEVKDFGADPPPDISHKNLEWRPFRRDPNPAFDPATEKLSSEVFVVDPTEIVVSRNVVALTLPELKTLDENKIRAAMLEMGFLLTELVNVLIAKNVIVADDVSAQTKQDYLNFKALVAKLRP